MLSNLSLRTKAVFYLILISLITILLFGIMMTVIGINRKEQAMVASFTSLATTLERTIEFLFTESPQISNQIIDNVTQINSNNLHFAILNQDQVAISPLSIDKRYTIRELIKSSSLNEVHQFTFEERTYLTTILESDTSRYQYFIAQDITSSVTTGINQIVITLGLGVVAILIVFFLTRFILTRTVINPIAQLATATQAIAAGKLNTRVQPQSHDEIGALTEDVNAMATKLESYIDQIHQVDKVKDDFIAIASHNLRTPVSELKGGLELLNRAHVDEALLQRLKDSVKNLEYLAENFLKIVTLESGKAEEYAESQIDLNQLLQEVVERNQGLLTEKAIQLTFEHSPTPLVVNGFPNQLADAFHHVLENAIKFSHPQGKVMICLVVKDEVAEVYIQDQGIGIPPAVQTQLFHKFQRGTDIMQYDYAGVGIGLYLTKLIIEQHRGEVILESEVDQGTTVTIRLPRE